MNPRDELEAVLRGWDRYEQTRGGPAIIDYDCAPGTTQPATVTSRLAVLDRLTDVAGALPESSAEPFASYLDAQVAYARALLGERLPLDDYVRRTQGCDAAGWSDEYVIAVGDQVRAALDQLGVTWGSATDAALTEVEGPVEVGQVADGIRATAAEMEEDVRRLTGSSARFSLDVEIVEVDAYWSYWLDGAGPNVRLRLNMSRASFSQVRLRQFALHEILGHGLQSASWSETAAREKVAWPRLSTVHGPNQVLSEGLAQALPLFVRPDDHSLVARVRLDHYIGLVRAALHRAINAGQPAEECAAYARARVPYWTDEAISDLLTDRGTDPQLRSYLWAYPAGIDWFVHLADDADPAIAERVLHAAYNRPLTPTELAGLWPAGPRIGGPGAPVRLRHPHVP